MARYVDIECDSVTEVIDRRAFKSRNDIQDFLDNIPTADVQEVKHGKWKKHIDDCDCDYIECSVCGEEFYPPNNEFTFDVIPKYCQECGAKMDGGKNE